MKSSTLQDPIKSAILAEAQKAAPVLERLPGVAIIHDIRDGTVVYMCSKGAELLGVSLETLQAMGPDYYPRFFNPEQAAEYVPHMLDLVARNNPDETFTFFQQVRIQGYEDWQWHLSAIRIFMQDKTGAAIATLTLAQHISPENHYTKKVERMLDELTFLREKATSFSSLGRRELEVLRLLAQGKTSAEIADKLFISARTAETHRRNIRKKLKARGAHDIDRFARAFDLI